MIRARVTLDTFTSNDSPREEWLNRYVGPRARESDQIDESRPWGAKYQFGKMVYYFAQESDATMFKLRWA